jgi:hypothetical protein
MSIGVGRCRATPLNDRDVMTNKPRAGLGRRDFRRARARAGGALAALPILLLTAGPAAAATTQYAGGLTTPAGGVVAPDGRWWVSDHNSGFCRVSGPAGATPGALEADTCLGGALAARPGPEAAGTPALHDPTPAAPNSGDELVYVPEGATGSNRVMRLAWNPATSRFRLNDSIALVSGLDADLRPTIASLGPDGNLYVATGRTPDIQRIVDPESDAPRAEIVGQVDRTLALAAGEDAAGKLAVYVGEPTGVTKLYPNAASPAFTQPTSFDLGLADVDLPYEPGGMAYDNAARALYVGTSVAAHAGKVDKLERFTVTTEGAGEPLASGLDGVSAVSVGTGQVAFFDGPVGDGAARMSVVDDARATPFLGPPPPAPVVAPTTGTTAPGATPNAGANGTAATGPGAGSTTTGQTTTKPGTSALTRVTRLSLVRRISVRRLRRGGLRLSMRVTPGTREVRVRITPRGAPARRKGASYRGALTRSGPVALSIRTRAVRRLAPGRYRVTVTPAGASGTGPATLGSFSVTR